MNILIIGDSFVEGVGSNNGNGWAQEFKSKYNQHTIYISGIGGDNIEKINKRLELLPSVIYDMIILQIGLNDSRYRPSKQANEVPHKEFIMGLKSFIDFFNNKNPNVQIIFLGITEVDESVACPYKPDKYYINGNIEKYNTYLQKFADSHFVRFISAPSLDKETCLSDGVHPNQNGHRSILLKVCGEISKNDII